MLKNLIHNLIQESIERNQKEGVFSDFVMPEVKIEYRGDALGDYASGVALNLSKVLNQNPIDIAEKIVSKIERPDFLDRVEVKNPGFVNFFVSRKFLQKEISHLLKEKGKYGNSSLWKGKKIIVEFTDPNPFKEFHIGHLYSNSVGEAICRHLEYFGAIVCRVNYQGDVGMPVAKAIWGLKKKEADDPGILEKLKKRQVKERIEFLGNAYSLGAADYEENEKAKKEMEEINYYVYIAAQQYLKEVKDFEPQVDYRQYIEVKDEELQEIGRL